MIRFSLRCDHAHRFDSWFGSGADFDRLSGSGLVACAICGSTAVEKDLMAPAIASASGQGERPETARGPGAAARPDPASVADAPVDLTAPASPAERALAALRRRIESESEDVGRRFATEARRIHEGTAPARPIIGEARPAEARALLEDGIPVAPLPWAGRRTN